MVHPVCSRVIWLDMLTRFHVPISVIMCIFKADKYVPGYIVCPARGVLDRAQSKSTEMNVGRSYTGQQGIFSRTLEKKM